MPAPPTRYGQNGLQAKPMPANKPRTAPPAHPPLQADRTIQPFGFLVGAAVVASAGAAAWLYDRFVASDEQRLRLRRHTTRLPLLGDEVLADTIDNALIERDAGRITIGNPAHLRWAGGQTARTGGAFPTRTHEVTIEAGQDRDLSTGYLMHELIHARVDNRYAVNSLPGHVQVHLNNLADYDTAQVHLDQMLQNAIDALRTDRLIPSKLKTHCAGRLTYAQGNPNMEFQTVCADILFMLYRHGIPKRSAFYRLIRSYVRTSTAARG